MQVAEIIKKLMGLGEMATLTQTLSDDAIQVLADEFDKQIDIVTAAEDASAEPVFEDADEDLEPRPPVITIMGHVDHGKTSLLDAIRETDVVAGEAGGITQHIGAYQVHQDDGRIITFLDTPGHEAFTAMRARGAQATDIAVIVVAADDGVRPQTREAVDHAKAADVPILVAVNKIDKEGAAPDRVRTEMTQLGLQPEEWGGDTMFVDVSAKTREGLDDLLEGLLLIADIEELTANPDAEASGTVIESKLDPGRGAVVTVLVQRGTLKIGDAVVAGAHWGRVRAMSDYTGKRVKTRPAGGAGRGARVRHRARGGRVRARRRERPQGPFARRRARQPAQARAAGAPLRHQALAGDDLRPARRHQGPEPRAQVRRVGFAGGLRGRDRQAPAGRGPGRHRPGRRRRHHRVRHHPGVGLGRDRDGLQRPPGRRRGRSADREGVEIRTYSIIYRAIDELRDAMQGMLAPETVEDVVGQVEVREIFRASKIGVIAGCMVTDGKVTRGAKVRLIRDGAVIHDGEIGSLRRMSDDVREVLQGFECGIVLANYQNVEQGDTMEVYETRQVERTPLRQARGRARIRRADARPPVLSGVRLAEGQASRAEPREGAPAGAPAHVMRRGRPPGLLAALDARGRDRGPLGRARAGHGGHRAARARRPLPPRGPN